MEAEHAIRSPGRLGDLGDREGARVGGEDDVAIGDRVERPEDRLLQGEVLEGRLDHEVGLVGQPVDGRDVADPVKPLRYPRLDPGRIEVQLPGAPRQPVADPFAAALDGGVIDVIEDDLAAGFERDLRDPGTHRPGPDDPDDGRQDLARRRRRGLDHQTDLMASNGWRQSAQ